ncbi:ATP synthase F0 subcomplex subunit H atp14 [Batrachochytrium dendrobatidis]|nr:ATP synthase F0 subcomplex subunit H atp14 [Batrachochytrium dendrobatidis]
MMRSTAVVGALFRHSTLVRASPVFARSFATTSIAKADSVTDLYLNYIRSYKPTAIPDRTDLPQTFSTPKAPAKPEFGTESMVAAAGEESQEEEKWHALKSPIDDPANYPDAWDYSHDTASDSLFPKRVRAYDFNAHEGH